MNLPQFTQNSCIERSTTTLNVTGRSTYYSINITLQHYVYLSREIKRSNFTLFHLR
jgi:hypothetical protein